MQQKVSAHAKPFVYYSCNISSGVTTIINKFCCLFQVYLVRFPLLVTSFWEQWAVFVSRFQFAKNASRDNVIF